MFDITTEDKLNIKLAEAVGVSHLAVSYPEVGHNSLSTFREPVIVRNIHIEYNTYIKYS